MLRKLVPILAVLLLFAAIPAKPQTVTRQAVLSWTAASDAVASSTYNVAPRKRSVSGVGLGYAYADVHQAQCDGYLRTDLHRQHADRRDVVFLCHTITERCRITTVEYSWR